jgi:hypothetical protein
MWRRKTAMAYTLLQQDEIWRCVMIPETSLTLESQAILEIGRFFAGQPTPEQIIAFHTSPELTERLYALVAAEKAGTITDEERGELDKYETIEHIVIGIKSEARKNS